MTEVFFFHFPEVFFFLSLSQKWRQSYLSNIFYLTETVLLLFLPFAVEARHAPLFVCGDFMLFPVRFALLRLRVGVFLFLIFAVLPFRVESFLVRVLPFLLFRADVVSRLRLLANLELREFQAVRFCQNLHRQWFKNLSPF